MDLCHSVEKATERLEDSCNFTEHILNNGSALHLLLMKKKISAQMLSLINNTPDPDVDISIKFKTNNKEFEEAVKKHFGDFQKKEECKVGFSSYFAVCIWKKYRCFSGS
jgi:hypothetical protein